MCLHAKPHWLPRFEAYFVEHLPHAEIFERGEVEITRFGRLVRERQDLDGEALLF